jgi:hypothetical protein
MFIIENCEHLKFLSLDSCGNKYSESIFTKLTTQNKNLIKLNIDRCDNCTDVSLNIISKMFLNLQELSIESNKNITDQGLIDFAKNNCSTLLKLNIQYCDEITDIGIIEITKILKHLNSFRVGNLNSFHSDIDESLIAISKNCLNLNVLNILYFNNNNAISTVTELKKLTELYFYCCCRLCDSNVIEMSKYFTNLKVFGIIANKNLTDKSIIAITNNSNNLNTLNIEFCQNITIIGYASIKNCLKLKFLTISNYNGYTISNLNFESCLTNIIKTCLRLKELNISQLDEYFVKNLKKQNLFITIIS